MQTKVHALFLLFLNGGWRAQVLFFIFANDIARLSRLCVVCLSSFGHQKSGSKYFYTKYPYFNIFSPKQHEKKPHEPSNLLKLFCDFLSPFPIFKGWNEKKKFEIKIKNSKIKGTKCIFIHLLNSEHGKIKVVNYYQCHIWYIFFNFIYFNNSKLSHVKSACH